MEPQARKVRRVLKELLVWVLQARVVRRDRVEKQAPVVRLELEVRLVQEERLARVVKQVLGEPLELVL